MLVITNRPQDEVNPRNTTNHPEKRHFLILDKILKNKKECDDISVVFPEEKDTEEKIIKILKQVHHPFLIDFLSWMGELISLILPTLGNKSDSSVMI